MTPDDEARFGLLRRRVAEQKRIIKREQELGSRALERLNQIAAERDVALAEIQTMQALLSALRTRLERAACAGVERWPEYLQLMGLRTKP